MPDNLGTGSFASGLSYPESPRWRDGHLWISDVHNFRLKSFERHGQVAVDISVPGRPAGTGFLPDGVLLVATALNRKLSVVHHGALVEVADLSHLARGLLNDMVVDRTGRAYVGDTGYDLGSGEPARPGRLILVDLAGKAQILDDEVTFPNGLAITADGRTLLLAETFANRITAYDIGDDGMVSGRRVYAELPGPPDGICLDGEGGLWAALLTKQAFVRIDADGRETHRYDCAPHNAVACAIGGEDGQTLYLCHAQVLPERAGYVSALQAPFRSAGLP